MRNSADFHIKKMNGLEAIRRQLLAIDRLYGDLVQLEDSSPGGDSYAEYATFNTLLSDVRGELEVLLETATAHTAPGH